MKRLLLILLCVPLIGFGQEKKEEIQMIDGIAYYNNKIFIGIEMTYEENGELFKEVSRCVLSSGGDYSTPSDRTNIDGIAYYKNKKFTGIEVSYDKYGRLFKETTFKNGKKDGLYKRFRGGSLSGTLNYKDGQLID